MQPYAFIANELIKTYGPKSSKVRRLPARKTSTSWPPNARPNGSYTVQRVESVMNIRHVFLPDGFTLRFNGDVDRVEWTVNLFEFGVGATISLTSPRMLIPPWPPLPPASPVVPKKPPQSPAFPGKAPRHTKGATGYPGQPGLQGIPGIPFKLSLNSIGDTGSLWIDTCGSIGGYGGAGGKGQTGGDTSCDDGEDYRTGGDGGTGGNGGDGGRGGDASTVDIQINSLPKGYLLRPVPGPVGVCGFISRPANANGDDGAVVVWGAPGCGGWNGQAFRGKGSSYEPVGGVPGMGGDPGGVQQAGQLCRSFPWNNWNLSAGKRGGLGNYGSVGPIGGFGLIQISGPQLKIKKPKAPKKAFKKK